MLHSETTRKQMAKNSVWQEISSRMADFYGPSVSVRNCCCGSYLLGESLAPLPSGLVKAFEQIAISPFPQAPTSTIVGPLVLLQAVTGFSSGGHPSKSRVPLRSPVALSHKYTLSKRVVNNLTSFISRGGTRTIHRTNN